MKTLFLHATSDVDVALPQEVIAKLPQHLGLVTTVQHLHKIHQVRKQLPNATMAGQVLGCRADAAARIAQHLDAFLYIGTGEFHPIQVALSTNKPIFLWNPVTKAFGELDKKTIATYKRRVQGAMNKFYHAKNVGVLITTKPGQNNNMITSPTLKEKMTPVQEILARNDGKKYYLFAFDTLSPNELENFPFIDVWMNLACSRIFDDEIKNLVNWQDVKQFEAEHVQNK